MAERRLEGKLERIRNGQGGREDFIIADAKDPDMGGGRSAPGPVRDECGPGDGIMENASPVC